MGQALRRVTGKMGSSRTPPPSVKDVEPVAPVRRQEPTPPVAGGSDAGELRGEHARVSKCFRIIY